MGRRDARALPLPLPPPTYRPTGCEAEGAVVGFTAPTIPRPPRLSRELLCTITLRETQPPTSAAADPLACRGVVVAGPASRRVPSRAWAGRLARPLDAT